MAANPGIKIEAYALSKVQLEQLAVKVSQLRLQIEERAKEMMLAQDRAATGARGSKDAEIALQEKSTFEVSRLAKKIKSREKFVAKMTGPIADVDYPEPVAAGLRCAVRKRKDLSPAEIAEIIHKLVVGYQLQADVTKEHRLKPILVSQLMNKAKKNPKFIHEIMVK